MERPQSAGQRQSYTMEEMFQVSNRNNSAFGIQGYNHPQQYQDPIKQQLQRVYEKQKKGQKTRKYVTKRGSYLDPIMIRDWIKYPKSVHYNVTNNMPEAKPKGAVKKYETKRNTFIDDIRNPKKVKEVPGVGKYNIILTEAQEKEKVKVMKAKKIKQGEKDNFLCNFERLANEQPGPGQYNPHYEVKKPKQQMTWDNRKDWIQKHNQQEKKGKKSKYPDVGTYNPEPAHIKTFGAQMKQKRPSSAQPGKMFGTQKRFKDKKEVKKQPGPGNYQLLSFWQGKPDKKNKNQQQQQNWQDRITKGVHEIRSIYY